MHDSPSPCGRGPGERYGSLERQHEIRTEGEGIVGALRVIRWIVVERLVVGIGVVPADFRTNQQSGYRRGHLWFPGHTKREPAVGRVGSRREVYERCRKALLKFDEVRISRERSNEEVVVVTPDLG